MKGKDRVVLDTNVLISGLLLPGSVPAQAVRTAVNESEILVSRDTLEELSSVLFRPKFDSLINASERQRFFDLLLRTAEYVTVTHQVRLCRDPKDDKYLELAISGGADLLITGDNDLLALSPFREIGIIRPVDYLGRSRQDQS